MLRILTFIVPVLTISLPAQVQTREQDSLALVALYDSTDGANWRVTWELNTPVYIRDALRTAPAVFPRNRVAKSRRYG